MFIKEFLETVITSWMETKTFEGNVETSAPQIFSTGILQTKCQKHTQLLIFPTINLTGH